MANKQLPVLVVGGGIGGMATALSLAKFEIPSIVFEQATEFRVFGSGLQFCPNTFKMIDYLGLLDSFYDIAIFPENLCYVDGLTGKEFMKLPLQGEFVNRFRYHFGSFRRNDVIQTFYDHCRKSPFIQLVTDAKIVKVNDEGSHPIVSSTKGQSFEGSAVIGCDGLWSDIRPYIDDSKLRISGQIIYRGVVHADQMPKNLRLENIVHYVRPNAHIVYYPIGKKQLFNISAIFQTDRVVDPRETIGKKEELYHWFQGSIPEIMELLERVDTTHMWSLNDRDPVRNWTKGRVTLLGDAAHPTLPYLTSGAGMAIEDAVVLAIEMSKDPSNYPAAFKRYQEQRYIRTSYVQLFSRAYGDVHHSDGTVRELRNSVISQVSDEEKFKWVSFLYKGIDLEAVGKR